MALEGTVGEVERGFGALLGLNAAAARTLPLDPGEVRWQRFGLELGPRYRVALASSVHLDLHVEAAAALLELRGVGFSRDLARQAFDFGGGGAARLGWRSRPFTPWVQLGARGWIPRQVVQVTQVEEQVTVPALELVLAAGMAWVSP